MFSGIIQRVIKIDRVERGREIEKGAKLWLTPGFSDLELGESIAVNGVCLTVAEIHHDQVQFDLSLETLERTHFKSLEKGDPVNLERALRANERNSGHFVQGHIDGVGEVHRVRESGTALLLEVQVPSELRVFCVEKGSIAINGVSLTINSILGSILYFTLVPHTASHTNLSSVGMGDPLNIEVDILAKYVEKLCQPYLKQ